MDIDAGPIVNDTGESPYVLFAVDDVVYGVSSSHVLSIEILQEPTPIVSAPAYTLGLLDFRGDMITLIGLRKLFNKSVRGSGLRRFMESNRAEYVQWMDELENAIIQDRTPEVSFDPHACSLGKWLDSFSSQSNTLNMHVQKMISPHQSLFAEGAKLVEIARRGEREEAIRLCGVLRTSHYRTMVELISSTAEAYVSGVREMLLVLNVNETTKGIVVDDIVSVEYINKFVELPGTGSQSKYVKSLAKRDRDDSTVLLMDEELIISL